MATTEDARALESVCPLCEEYTGKPASVEAHISRNTDEAHKGEVGSSFREVIEEQMGNLSTESVHEDAQAQSNGKTGPAGDQEDSNMVTDDEYLRQDPLVEDDDQEDSDDQEAVVVEETETSSFGLPWEAVILVIAVGLVVFWLRYRSRSTRSNEQDRQGVRGGRGDLLG